MSAVTAFMNWTCRVSLSTLPTKETRAKESPEDVLMHTQ